MKKIYKKSRIFLTLVTLFAVQTAMAEPQTSLDKGIIQYQRENYDEALSLLKEAKAEEPANIRVSYYLGLIYKKLQDYKQAQSNLTEAVEGTPKIKEALLELIEVCYQIDDVESAKKWIGVAEEQGMRPGQTKFIKGLVLMKDGKTEDAIQAFKDSKDFEPALKQSANYQIGLAHLKNKSYDEAARNFQEVVLLDPNTDIARYADEYKKVLDRRHEAEKPFRLNAAFFEEYDDNVILKPSDTSSTGDIGNQSDWREVATVDAELGKKFNDAFGAKLQYDFYFTKQNDLHAYDLNSHTVGAVPSFYLGENVVSVPVQYNYTWVDNDDFLSTLTANPLANIKVADNQLAQIGVKFQDLNYLQVSVNPDENRDAARWAPGGAWFYFFNQNKSFLNIRYEYDTENTKGSNWDYDGNRATVAAQMPIIEQWKLTLVGDAYLQDFDNMHTTFNVKRSDENYSGSAMLSYAINKDWELQLRYTHVDHRSNINIYQYTRNIVSTGITAKF
ncbi:MAG: hypothetical protein AUJ72_02405 [Candidatus Omnitrophica bacterium CG1_02_46_14]|nr:MAG: hypothetical protein AUJ72_02405 [Candidatus Omnitrophica bacterium CG1_02_46_14]